MRSNRRPVWVLLVATLAMCLTTGAAMADEAVSRCASPKTAPRDLLSIDLESLLNIKVITASKFSENLSDAPGVISVVSQDELRRFGATTVREALERVPGLSVSTAYFTDRSMVAAHGDQTKINGGHVLFLINGRPTREVLEGGLVSDVLESFPVSGLERIEVIKGPGSVLYGSNAFSAVINLITLKAERSGFSVSAAPGGSGARSTAGEGTFTCGELSIVGAGQTHQKANWNTTYGYDDPIPGDPPGGKRVAPVQDISIRDRSQGGYLGLSYRGLSVMSSFTEWRTAAFIRGSVGEDRWRRGFADVGYVFKASSVWTMNVNLTYTRNLFGIEEYPSIKRDSNEAVLELTNFVNPTDRDQLTFGALYNHVQGKETYYGLGFPIDISNGQRSGSGGYVQLDHRLRKGVKLIGGFQANKIGELNLDVVPRAGVLWTPVANVNVKALYGSAFRAPSINETGLNHPGLSGNPDLKPEKVGTFDLELSYHGDRAQAGINYFHSKQTDSIVVDTRPARWRYLNLGEATFQGFELEGKCYVTRQFYLLGSLLHQANTNGDGVGNVTPVPNTGAKAGFSYQADNGLTASIFDSYQGAVNGFSGRLNPQPAAYHLLGGQLRFDVSRFLHSQRAQGFTLFARADNLTNKYVWLPDWGNNAGDTIPSHGGRTVYVGGELSLNRSSHAVPASAGK